MILRVSAEPACSYLYINDSEREDGLCEAMLVDASCSALTVKNVLDEKHAVLKYIVLTHGHYDHVTRLKELREAFPEAETVCHVFENDTLSDIDANVSDLFSAPQVFPVCENTVGEGDELVLKGRTDSVFKVVHTPGHTPGSICLFNEKDRIIFTGDTLFAHGGIGRIDFKGGNGRQMSASLERLSAYDPETVIIPGHGGLSTIGDELSFF